MPKNVHMVSKPKHKPKRTSKATAFPRQIKTMSGLQEASAPVFPSRTTRKIRYSDSFSLSSTAGVVAGYVFSANGLYDPNITGTGHQPMGFDQLMLSYNHYAVTHATISVLFKSTASAFHSCAVRVAADAVIPTTPTTILEYGLLNTDTLEAKGVYGDVKRLSESVNIKKIQGVTNVVDDPSLRGDAASNPTEQTYFQIMIFDQSGGSCTCSVEVVIDFVAVFTEPRLLTASQIFVLKEVFAKSTEGKSHK